LHLEQEAHEVLGGETEVDESYFRGVRKGKRGRGAAGKAPVFGLLKRGGKVYTKIIPDAKSGTLIPPGLCNFFMVQLPFVNFINLP
jgi:transposase